ncbi:LysR family transcriptional regulator [Brevundimonas goettingensis]|uniref:LysR family transcriptional regulator n=1 Tax=Brevundimonas goettingensis TaxID=2774190 RepID=A0A975C154_9CAUL|nr:LysR family transcriptional regulator [Brevundimonas goettingensis]QTC89865.1 LysR family transcriptional regulator [Brevundimonas goettingensis]
MKPFDLNIRHLRAVAAVVDTGSISAAARVVNLTQPAITQGIAKLERQICLPLFERRPGGMVPTAAAELLAPRVMAAIRLMDSRHATAAQVSAFLALARCGSYAAAAVETGLSEPSLHRAVGDLSLAVGHILVERRGKGVALTPRGIGVARRFRLGEAELRSALFELALLEGREVGRITVGAMPLSRARLLPAAVTAFHALHSEISVGIVEGSHAELVGPLRDGEIDLMVGALRPKSTDDSIIQTPLFEDRPVILARAGHPLADLGGPITPEAMTAYPWITPAEGTPLRAQWQAMFAGAGAVAPSVPIECGSVIMVRQMLLHSDFLTLLSPDQVAVELEAGWLVKVADAPGDVSRTIGVTTRADWRPTALQRRFLGVLKEQAEIIAAAP